MAGQRRGHSALRLWHRWFGLIAGTWLLLLAITGTVIVFYDELDTWLNPDLRTAAITGGPPASLDTIVATAGATLPGFAPTMIELPGYPGESIMMMGRAEMDGHFTPVQVFADPTSGTILGWRENGRIALDARHIMDVFYGLHVDLLSGEWATQLLGFVSLLWLLDHVFSIALSLPRGGRKLGVLAVKGRAGSLRRLLDLHRAPGLWLTVLTFTLALTGLTLAWPETTREATELVSPMSGRLHETMPDLEDAPPFTPIGIEKAITIVTGDARDTIHSVRLFPHEQAYAVRTYNAARDLDDQGRQWTYVHMIDGTIIGTRHDNGSSGGDQFFAWQYPLHSGKAFGEIGRWLVFLGGLATVHLCIGGWMLWARRRPRKLRRA